MNEYVGCCGSNFGYEFGLRFIARLPLNEAIVGDVYDTTLRPFGISYFDFCGHIEEYFVFEHVHCYVKAPSLHFTCYGAFQRGPLMQSSIHFA